MLFAIIFSICLAAAAKAQAPATDPDLFRQQNEVLEQRIKLLAQPRTAPASDGKSVPAGSYALDRDDLFESRRVDYPALAGVAPELVKEFACAGRNVVLYGPSQSESLFQLRVFYDELEELRTRLKSLADAALPSAPDKQTSSGAEVDVAALSAPVLQSVLDLISSVQGAGDPGGATNEEEAGLIAVVGNAAISQGCNVFWPSQLAVDPFNPKSGAMESLQTLAALNDAAPGQPPGLQQRAQALKIELARVEGMRAELQRGIAEQQARLTNASGQIDELKAEIELISGHIVDQKNTAIQQKLNRTFEKSWEETDAAVRKQLASALPGTLEEQNKQGEMTRRIDVLKTRTDWLSQYVKDEQDLALQDKLRRFLTARWDLYEDATKRKQDLLSAVPKAVEPLSTELRKWDRYGAGLRDLIDAFNSASDAYSTFRGALLNGSSGGSPLSRMLRAEALRNLTFDDSFQARQGASVIQLVAQRVTMARGNRVENGYALSFVQYEPNGKLKNTGVRTVSLVRP